jgi:hypothetical protein
MPNLRESFSICPRHVVCCRVTPWTDRIPLQSMRHLLAQIRTSSPQFSFPATGARGAVIRRHRSEHIIPIQHASSIATQSAGKQRLSNHTTRWDTTPKYLVLCFSRIMTQSSAIYAYDSPMYSFFGAYGAEFGRRKQVTAEIPPESPPTSCIDVGAAVSDQVGPFT